MGSNSNAGACLPNQYYCNENQEKATCADNQAGLGACKAADICQMPFDISSCLPPTNPECVKAAGSTHDGSYCCKDAPGAPGFSQNVVNLTLISGPDCQDPAKGFL